MMEGIAGKREGDKRVQRVQREEREKRENLYFVICSDPAILGNVKRVSVHGHPNLQDAVECHVAVQIYLKIKKTKEQKIKKTKKIFMLEKLKTLLPAFPLAFPSPPNAMAA
jgi:hypothetical protein